MIPIFAVEAICLITTTIRLRRKIRTTLEPLRELRAATEAFQNAEMQGKPGYSPENLRRLAGALDQVNVKDLNAHFSSEMVSAELRPLATSISMMLERIEAGIDAQSRFVSDASHELRTPIAVIQGYANMLARWGAEDPVVLGESIEAIRSEADSMKQLVNRLLFLARGDSDNIEVNIKSVNLLQIVNDVVREEEMIDNGHNIIVGVSDDDAFALADADLIKQLLRILVDNSIKYTLPGGNIEIRARKSERDEMVNLIIQDDGAGIPPDVLPNIFDRFVRAEESRARDTGGSGLGLSIAKWIVDRHSGYIDVLSREELGSRFTISLPASTDR
jgi:signal transduction histidine kinase